MLMMEGKEEEEHRGEAMWATQWPGKGTPSLYSLPLYKLGHMDQLAKKETGECVQLDAKEEGENGFC